MNRCKKNSLIFGISAVLMIIIINEFFPRIKSQQSINILGSSDNIKIREIICLRKHTANEKNKKETDKNKQITEAHTERLKPELLKCRKTTHARSKHVLMDGVRMDCRVKYKLAVIISTHVDNLLIGETQSERHGRARLNGVFQTIL